MDPSSPAVDAAASTTAPAGFPAEVVAAVVGHLNDDHAEDLRTLARTLGGIPAATAARAADVDTTALLLDVEVDGARHTVPIPFEAPVTDRAGLRPELVRLTLIAREALDPPSTAGAHR